MGVEMGHVAISRDLFCNHPFAHFYVRSFTIWKFTPNGLIACMRVFCLDNREVVVEWMDISPFAILKWWFLITYFKIFDWNERLRLSHVIIVHLHFYTLRHMKKYYKVLIFKLALSNFKRPIKHCVLKSLSNDWQVLID